MAVVAAEKLIAAIAGGGHGESDLGVMRAQMSGHGAGKGGLIEAGLITTAGIGEGDGKAANRPAAGGLKQGHNNPLDPPHTNDIRAAVDAGLGMAPTVAQTPMQVLLAAKAVKAADQAR